MFTLIVRCIIGATLGALVGFLLSKTAPIQRFIWTRKIRMMEETTATMLKLVRR